MTAKELRKKYIDFFLKKKHKQIRSVPLIPENDPTTLFTSSGMQPLIPYLLGGKHPLGTQLVNSQLCFRAEDINEVGDNRHTTFFEMLGNWSLGDYFKEEQLPWFFEFLTKEVGLNPDKLYVTVFEGNKIVPKDEESIKIWQKLFKTNKAPQSGSQEFDSSIKIYTYGVDKNWWSRSGPPNKMPVGEIGGPDSEVFYDFGEGYHNSKFGKHCHVNCDCGRFLEIGNSVFIEYEKISESAFENLSQRNVDFGGGLERILAVYNNNPDIFSIDIFQPIIQEIEGFCDKKYEDNKESMRIIADHLKAATFMIAEGIEPSNKLQGYMLRRLLRRSAVKMHQLKGGLTPVPAFEAICNQVIRIYEEEYFDSRKAKNLVSRIINEEMSRFNKSLDKGLRKLKSASDNELNTLFAFDLFQTYGFPLEITEELFKQRGKSIDRKKFEEIYKKHQELSRTASKGMFKGGLADHSESVTKLHTTTHLLHQALRQVLGVNVKQSGSNITSERLRFDFIHPKKLTKDEIKKVEELVNEKIIQNLLVSWKIVSSEEAKQEGTLALFDKKYGDKVKVYSIGGPIRGGQVFSKEVCAGPHVDFTGALGKFKIIKEESAGAGLRRIYGVLNHA